MKLYYFFGCMLATASLAVCPEIGLAHGGGGGGGGGGHGFGGGGGGHAFFGGGGHAFGGFTGRGFSPGFSGTRGFATGRFSGRGDHGRFGDRGLRGRDRDFRDHRRFFVGFDFVGFGFPYWWYPDDYYYGYYGDPYDDASYDNSPVYDYRYWYGLASAVQTELARRGYYHGPIDGVIGFGSREAIRDFQEAQGRPATGLIDPALLKALRLPAVPPKWHAPAA
jgi:Putative peptidoglycan binding domain